MKTRLMEWLICPACLPSERALRLKALEKEDDEIVTGALTCTQCARTYPVENGIATLLLKGREDDEKAQDRYETASVLSSYLWSHFSDLFGDREASAAYKDWADVLHGTRGFSLDAGCAVGRFTFEMGQRSEWAIGIDYSRSFIETARELMKKGVFRFALKEEGRLSRWQTVQLPAKWNLERVEFIVGDAQVLPFRSDLFSTLASLNVVDKVPRPLAHLREMSRVGKRRGAQFLFSDPFSWSTEVAREEDWLGGITEGPYAGSGIENVQSLLRNMQGEGLGPPWKIENKGHVWWKIRSHRNHFELIRSCYIRAVR